MPTLLKKMGNAWQARVFADGKQIASKIFPSGKKGGPEWREAKEWEEQQKTQYLAGVKTLSDFDLLLAWGEGFLEHTKRTTSPKDLAEKTRIMKAFFVYCRQSGIKRIEDVTPPKVYSFLFGICDTKGGNVANKYRKRLMTAWTWGIDFVEGFPQGGSPFKKVKTFPGVKKERYVPSEEDVIKVMGEAKGQDFVMLMAFYYTGARANEIFRLTWSDIDFTTNMIRLTDRKTKGKGMRERFLPMHAELVKALKWWKGARPCTVNNVFMRVDHHAGLGQPFTARAQLMPKLCERAGVKPFGFHALRHKAAAVIFTNGGLNAAQELMGHNRATTTDGYVRSAGLYSNKQIIPEILSNNPIGRAISEMAGEIEMPLEVRTQEAICKQALVTQ